MTPRLARRILYPLVTLFLILGQLLPLGTALAGAPPNSAARQAGSNLACDFAWSYSNVRFNSAAVSEITVAPGASVRMQYDYSSSNATGSSAVRQFLAGYALGASRTVIGNMCAYDGIPVECPAATTGSFDHTFAAPSTPGNYGIYIYSFLHNNCTEAKSSWLSSGTGDLVCTMHVVAPTATPTTCPDYFGYSNVRFNGVATSSVSTWPGQTVRIQYDYALSEASGGATKTQILTGYSYEFGGRAVFGNVCAFDGHPITCPSVAHYVYDYTWTAPSNYGNYDIYISQQWYAQCVNAISGWVGSGGGVKIGTIFVGLQPPPTPSGTPTATYTPVPPPCEATMSYSNVRFNSQATSEIWVAPGQAVQMQYNYSLSNSNYTPASDLKGPTDRRQILAGYDGQQTDRVLIGNCAYDGVPAACPSTTSGSFSHTFSAPGAPGDYTIYIAELSDPSCSDARADWLDSGSGSHSVCTMHVIAATPTRTRTRTATPTSTATGTATLTATPLATVTPTPTTSRAAYTIGVVQITSDLAEDLPGGGKRYSGNVWLGQYLQLTGLNDSVTDNGTTLVVNGMLAYRAAYGGTFLSQGVWNVTPSSGIGSPAAGLASQLTQVGAFTISASTLSSLNVLTGVLQGTTTLTLPSPFAATALSFSVGPGPAYTGSIPSLGFGGLRVTTPVGLNASGLFASAATLQGPAALGGQTRAISNLQITPSGFTIAGGTNIPVPDLFLVNSSKAQVKLYNLNGVKAAGVSTSINVSGKLSLFLPQNNKTDVTVNFALNGDGTLGSAALADQALSLAGATLTIRGLSFGAGQLLASSAVIALPGKLSAISKTLTGAVINANGLTVEGSLSFSLPNLKVGTGGAGFEMSGVSCGLEFAGNGDYSTSTFKLRLTGTIGIQISGSGASAGGTIYLDSAGNVSGTLNNFSLSVAGMSLSATGISLTTNPAGGFSIASATLSVPGGGYASVTNLLIVPPAAGQTKGRLQIGSATLRLPTINVGGCTINLEGTLTDVGTGYEISCTGSLSMASLGAAGGCSGITISATVYATADNEIKVDFVTKDGRQIELGTDSTWALDEPSLQAVQLRQASIQLECQIPIGNSGFFLTSMGGSITLYPSVSISVNATIAAGREVLGVSVASFQGSMTLVPSPFSINLQGNAKIFIFTVGSAYARTGYQNGYLYFSAGGWMTIMFAGIPIGTGSVAVDAWTNASQFHFSGAASLEIGWRKGTWWQGCVNYICCPNGSIYWGGNCWPWKVHKCPVCISVPPFDLILAGVYTEVGEFTNGKWGFKGNACILNGLYCSGFYIDTTGKMVLGNVDAYHRVTVPFVEQARQEWAAYQRGELQLAAWDKDISFTPSGDALVSLPITKSTDILVGLTRTGDAPLVTLITPGGLEITPDNLPAGFGYNEVITYTGTVAVNPAADPAIPCATCSACAEGQELGAGETLAQTKQAKIKDFSAQQPELADKIARQAMETGAALQSEDETRLRVIQAIPGVGAVDVRLSGGPTISGAAYGAVTSYINLLPGVYPVSVVPAGAAGPVLASGSLEALIGSDYTLAVAGLSSAPQLLTFEDENDVPSVPTGQGALRVINLSPNAGPVDIGWAGGDTLFTSVGYAQAVEPVEALAGMTLDLQVRISGSGAIAATLPAVTLQENRLYTLFVLGLRPGAPGISALLHRDAEPAPRLRILHAAAAAGEVDVLLDGARVYSSLPFGWMTHYEPIEASAHILRVVPVGQSGPVLLERVVSLSAGQDRTLVIGGATPPMESWELADNNSLPAVGRARVRVAHAAPGAPAVDVRFANGAALVTNVGYGQASSYAVADAGTLNLVIRRAGTTDVLLTLENVVLDPGSVYTLSLVGIAGGSPALRGTVHHDVAATGRVTQVTYAIGQAQTGDWKVKLSGYYAPTDRYELVVIGAKPRPALTEVRATSTGPTAAEVNYRLSGISGTLARIYANPGTASPEDAPAYEGILLQTITAPALDGSLQNAKLDLSTLASGPYRLWMEADDQNNSPVRLYAPDVITVTQGWQSSWTAGLQVAQEYGSMRVNWNRAANPDVDGYALVARSGLPEATAVITVGNTLTTTLWAVTPGQEYALSVEAYDEATGRRSTSGTTRVTALTADFTLSAANPNPAVTSGNMVTVTLLIKTDLAPYPASVGLSLAAVPDGLSAELGAASLVPSLAGVQVPLRISASKALPSGNYDVILEGTGGGVSHTLTLRVTVEKPYFSLAATPDDVVLPPGGSTSVTISAQGFGGANSPILLSLVNPPAGLDWELSAPSLLPGESVTLTLRDSELLRGGQRTLRLVGEDGLSAWELPVAVIVVKLNLTSFPMIMKP